MATMRSSAPPQEEVELTDDQIQQLLLEAENRLRGSDNQVALADDVASIRYAADNNNLCSRISTHVHVESPSCLPAPTWRPTCVPVPRKLLPLIQPS